MADAFALASAACGAPEGERAPNFWRAAAPEAPTNGNVCWCCAAIGWMRLSALRSLCGSQSFGASTRAPTRREKVLCWPLSPHCYSPSGTLSFPSKSGGRTTMLITARILLTLAALGFSAITIVADLNKTHAANPLVDAACALSRGLAGAVLFRHRADRALPDLGRRPDADRAALSRRRACGCGLWRLFRRRVQPAALSAAGLSTPTAIRRSGRRSAQNPGCGTSM